MRGTRRAGNASEAAVEETAEYFDRTDAGELPWEEATEVTIERPDLEQVSIRLPKQDLEALRRRAARVGVGYTTLIRMILHQHVQDPFGR
ncbi:MAG TPA: CopG family antitoxin [Chloroflexota bacterium]|nr:CopG family antitoxin [Chloroflexota bacterium]